MTQKFWLASYEIDPSTMVCASEAEAVKQAHEMAKNNPEKDCYVMEAKWHYKSKPSTINKVIETQLHEKQGVPIETPLDATPEELSEVVPKFKIGDRIYHIALKQYGVITQYDSGNKRICLVLFDGDKAENIVSLKFLVTQTI